MLDINNSPWNDPATSWLYEPVEITLPTGQTISVDINPQSPQRWVVSVGAIAGVKVQVYVGPNPFGRFFSLYGGGKATIPADGASLSLRNVGANTAVIQVIGVRGYDFVDIDCGEVA